MYTDTYLGRVRQAGGPVQKADASTRERERQHWSDAALAAYADLDRWSRPVAGDTPLAATVAWRLSGTGGRHPLRLLPVSPSLPEERGGEGGEAGSLPFHS